MLFACSPAGNELGHQLPEPGKILFGYSVWIGDLPLMIAGHKGYFKEAGLDVELKEYEGLKEMTQDYQDGKIQGRTNVVMDVMEEYIRGMDQRIVLGLDFSNGADGIACSKELSSPKQFQGKRVGYEKDTLTQYFLHYILAKHDLTLDETIHVEADPGNAAKLLLKGEIDVAVTYEPYLSEIHADDRFHVPVTSATEPGLIIDVITFKTAFVENYPDAVLAFCRAYFRSLEYIQEHPDEVQGYLAKKWETTKGDITAQMKGVQNLGLQQNVEFFKTGNSLLSFYGNTRAIYQYIEEAKGKSLPDFDSTRLIEPRFVKELSQALEEG